jgi:hypothetical protein
MYNNVPFFYNRSVELQQNFMPIGLGNGVDNPIVKIQKLIQNIDCYQYFCFQFPDVARVANIHRQIWTKLANLLQKTLKTVARRHKCGDTIHKKPVFCCFLANFFLKNREFAIEFSVFRNRFAKK